MKAKFNILNELVLLLVLLPWLLTGCGPASQVFTDYDRSVNMGDYHTFGWLPANALEGRENPLFHNELNDKRIKQAVARELESRNYKYSENPELVIHYHIILEDKTVVYNDPYGYYGPYWMRTQVDVYQYKEGTLVIDLMDAKTDNLVWRGWMTAFVKNRNPEKMEESINTAVRMIFSQYPYRAIVSEPVTE